MAKLPDLNMVLRVRDQATRTLNRFTASAQRGMQRMGRAVAFVSRTLLPVLGLLTGIAAVGGAAGIFAGSITSATAFGKAMAEVNTLVEDNIELTDRLRTEVERLSVAYGQAPVDTAKALYDTISSGFDATTEAVGVLDVANRLAIAGVTDVNTAFAALNATMQPFQIEAARSAEVADALVQTVFKGRVVLPQLAQYLGQVAPSASLANVQLAELLASMATLTALGQEVPQATTKLRAFFVAVQSKAQEAKKINDEFNLSLDFSTVALKNKGLITFIEDIQAQLSDLDEVTRNTVLGRLLGSNEAVDAFKLLGGVGLERYKDALEGIADSGGSVASAFEKMSAEVDFQMNKLKAQVQVAMGRLGATFEGGMIKILDFLFDVFAAASIILSDWDDSINASATSFAEDFVNGTIKAGRRFLEVMFFVYGYAMDIWESAKAMWVGLRVAANLAITGILILVNQMVQNFDLGVQASTKVWLGLKVVWLELQRVYLGVVQSLIEATAKNLESLEGLVDFTRHFDDGLGKAYDRALAKTRAFAADYQKESKDLAREISGLKDEIAKPFVTGAGPLDQVIKDISDSTVPLMAEFDRLWAAAQDSQVEHAAEALTKLEQYLLEVKDRVQRAKEAMSRPNLNSIGIEEPNNALEAVTGTPGKMAQITALFKRNLSEINSAITTWQNDAEAQMKSFGTLMEQQMTHVDGFFRTTADGLVEGSYDIKKAVSDMAKSIIKDLTAMILKMIAFGAIGAALGLIVGGPAGALAGARIGASIGSGGLLGGGGGAGSGGIGDVFTGVQPRDGGAAAAGAATAFSAPGVVDNRVINVFQTIEASDPDSFAKQMRKNKETVNQMMKDALRADTDTRTAVKLAAR